MCVCVCLNILRSDRSHSAGFCVNIVCCVGGRRLSLETWARAMIGGEREFRGERIREMIWREIILGHESER